MTALRDLSLIYSSLHSLILFLILFVSKYPRRKTLTLTFSFMVPLISINFILSYFIGFERMGTLLLLTASLPSLIFFFFLAKHRGGRYIFTFCLADTLVLELIYATGIMGHFLENSDLFLFLSRLLIFPVLDILCFLYLRPMYLLLQNKIEKGWYLFSSISILFYVLLSISANYPTFVAERREDLPAFLLLSVLMPLLYLHFFATLRYQQKNYEIAEQENILKLQVENMKNRIEEFLSSNEKFRMERHNFRHKLQTITALIDRQQYQELHSLIEQYNEAIEDTVVKRYCDHPILDSALASYLGKAERKKIKVSTKLDFPDVLPANETELATVFANALENAIHACDLMDSPKKHIDLKAVSSPCFMFQIRNSFNGIVSFDSNHVPVSSLEDHGFGTRSIVAFCEKYKFYYSFQADGDLFSLQIMCDSEKE